MAMHSYYSRHYETPKTSSAWATLMASQERVAVMSLPLE